jgi:hypothetical protein
VFCEGANCRFHKFHGASAAAVQSETAKGNLHKQAGETRVAVLCGFPFSVFWVHFSAAKIVASDQNSAGKLEKNGGMVK